MTPRLMVWVCIAIAVLLTVPPGWCAESGGRPLNQQVTRPVQEAVTIRQTTQKQEEQWRDDQQKLVALYEKLQAEQEQLKTTHDELQENIAGTRGRIAEKEKQLAAIEQIRTRIEPFLHESLEALRQQIERGSALFAGRAPAAGPAAGRTAGGSGSGHQREIPQGP